MVLQDVSGATVPDAGVAPGLLAHPKYRPDIDGLRAVAVLAVLAFHLNLGPFDGGFVGVDVFFVISGYLIGLIILTEAENGSFSILRFYDRRIRRILPALFVMLAVTSVVCAGVLLPGPLKTYSESLIACVLSAANLFFYGTTNYFGDPAGTQPLIHTWSLGVEEQFYIFFPLLVMLARRWFPRHLKLVCLAVAYASFALGWWLLRSDPSAAFYLPTARAWELMIGVLLAAGVIAPTESRVWREAIGLTGAFMIAVAIFTFDKATPFPGFPALMPCIGTAAIIHSGAKGDTLVARALSVKPVVFVGLISYSLYLWHWPLIPILDRHLLSTFADHSYGKVALLLGAIAVATLSWRFVERPFRGKARIGRRTVFVSAGAAALVLIGIGLAGVMSGGWPGRFSAQEVRLAAFLDNYETNDFRQGQCFLSRQDPYGNFDRAACLPQAPGKPNVLVLGDSHAAHLWAGLTATLDANVMQATAQGCRPTWPLAGDAPSNCARLMSAFFEGKLLAKKPDLLVLAGLWRPDDVKRLPATLDTLKAQGVNVVLMGPVPAYKHSLPLLLVQAERRGDPGLPRRERDHSYDDTDARMAAIAAAKGVRYVSLTTLLCGDGACLTTLPNGNPVQFDTGHLTAEASAVVMRSAAQGGAFGAIPLRQTSGANAAPTARRDTTSSPAR
jgi:peptidoglycan/LPS O-acetylase OafA/YrhL